VAEAADLSKAPEDGEGGGRPVRTARTLAKFVAAAVSLVATVVALTFTLWPSLKPEGPPAVKGGSISNVRVVAPISFRQYLLRAELPARGYGAAKLASRGAYVEYDLDMEGYKGAKLPLRLLLFRAKDNNLVSQSKDVLFKPLADRDHASWRDWVPVRLRGSYYITLELYNPSGRVPIARKQSKVFRGGAA
jgi:hypothetical protein